MIINELQFLIESCLDEDKHVYLFLLSQGIFLFSDYDDLDKLDNLLKYEKIENEHVMMFLKNYTIWCGFYEDIDFENDTFILNPFDSGFNCDFIIIREEKLKL